MTESNVRGFEWTIKETDILLDDLIDAALGNLGGGALTSKDKKNPQAATPETAATVPTTHVVADYELSQIVLVPTSDWDASLLGLGNRYDVYDGQQRLVTLNLLLAALRDSFQKEAEELQKSRTLAGGGKRAVALEATAKEISNMLVPTKVRKEDVLRITLRKRDNVILERILLGDKPFAGYDDGGNLHDGDEAEDDVVDKDRTDDKSALVPNSISLLKLTPKQRFQLLSPLSPPNARILQNFLHLAERLSILTTRERLRLLDYMVERLHLLVCVPETARIARNIVMAQGRKGMDNEPVDDFKGLVCFR